MQSGCWGVGCTLGAQVGRQGWCCRPVVVVAACDRAVSEFEEVSRVHGEGAEGQRKGCRRSSEMFGRAARRWSGEVVGARVGRGGEGRPAVTAIFSRLDSYQGSRAALGVACEGRAWGRPAACVQRTDRMRAPALASRRLVRTLGTVAAPDDENLRSLGRGDANIDAPENAQQQGWARTLAPTPEQSRLRVKLEETGVCAAYAQRRSDAWVELSGLHTQLQTKLAVGNTAVLPDSWTSPTLIGCGIVGPDGVAMPAPPARWQLGRENPTQACAGKAEHNWQNSA